jgi:hypothetical protein
LLIILILACSSLIMVKPAFAQSIPKPSVPNFTVYLIDRPYDVPATTPTYTTDPYTGEQKMQNPGYPGYHVDNLTIELWIQNQQLSYSNGTTTFKPYYDVRTKGHFDQSWRELYAPYIGYHTNNFKYNTTFVPTECPAQSNSSYTVISYSARSPPYNSYDFYPSNAQIDFQVATIIGHNSQMFVSDHPFAPYIGHEAIGVEFDTMSEWSSTQTITISNSSLSTSTPSNPTSTTPTPIPIAVPEFSSLAIQLSLITMVAVAGLLVYFKKRKAN